MTDVRSTTGQIAVRHSEKKSLLVVSGTNNTTPASTTIHVRSRKLWVDAARCSAGRPTEVSSAVWPTSRDFFASGLTVPAARLSPASRWWTHSEEVCAHYIYMLISDLNTINEVYPDEIFNYKLLLLIGSSRILKTGTSGTSFNTNVKKILLIYSLFIFNSNEKWMKTHLENKDNY